MYCNRNRMATFNYVLRSRRSIKDFSGGPIKDEVIKKIIGAASLAPSVNNEQNWNFFVLKYKNNIMPVGDMIEEKLRELLKDEDKSFVDEKVEEMTFFKYAPVVIFVFNTGVKCYDEAIADALEKNGLPKEKQLDFIGRPDLIGIGAAIENILLKACELGIGTCCMTDPVIFKKDILKFLDLPENWDLVSIIPLGRVGYGHPPVKKIKDLSEILTIKGELLEKSFE